jgi:outer membrane protein assembly factor BamA
MKRSFFLLLTVLVLASSLPVAAQKFQPRTIQFKGAPEYSGEELLAAAGLQKGAELTSSEVNIHGQTLLDTGLFESFSFAFNGVDLVYTLVPAGNLYPVRLENLPLTPGKELDAALRSRVPLYRGKVPFEAALTEQVRQALEEMLAARGIKTNVLAVPYNGPRSRGVTAISYSITTPPVRVGEIHIDAGSAPLDPKAMEILTKLTGANYDVEGSPAQIETYLGNYYHDQGHLEASIHATQQGAPVIAPEAVHIPFLISVSPGPLYKLAGIQLTPDVLVTQAEIDRHSHIHRGDVADGQQLIENWQFIHDQYLNKGYMKAAVHPTASYDRAQGTVSFTVSVEPGPVYTMGKLTIQNSAADLRAAMLAAWKMPTGAVFNESAIQTYYSSQGNTPLGRTFASANCKSQLTVNDDTHTVDVTLRLEKK